VKGWEWAGNGLVSFTLLRCQLPLPHFGCPQLHIRIAHTAFGCMCARAGTTHFRTRLPPLPCLFYPMRMHTLLDSTALAAAPATTLVTNLTTLIPNHCRPAAILTRSAAVRARAHTHTHTHTHTRTHTLDLEHPCRPAAPSTRRCACGTCAAGTACVRCPRTQTRSLLWASTTMARCSSPARWTGCAGYGTPRCVCG